MAEIARDRLRKVPFTEELGNDQLEALAHETRVISVAAGKVLSDGDRTATSLYYVESGHLRVEVQVPKGQKTNYRDAGQGEYIGLYPLITGLPATVDARATRDSTLLAFPADMLHRYLVSGVRQQACQRGEVLFKQDQTAEYLYFVLEGKFLLEREVETPEGGVQMVRRSAGPGEYLGRYALITGEVFRTTATAQQNTSVLAIPFRALQPLLFIHPRWREWFFPLELAERLRAIPLFKVFEDWDIYLLADEAIPQQLKPGDPIYSVEDPAEHFYVIDRGQVEEQPRDGEGPWYLASGNYFGEDSLKGGWQRKATTAATKPTRLLRLPGRVVGELLQQRKVDLADQDTRGALVNRLSDVPLLRVLSRDRLRHLAGYVNLVYFRPGDIVARQEEPADRLMILHEGEAVVLRKSAQERARPVRRLTAHPHDASSGGESEHFGARSLVGRETRGATVEATQPSTWIVLERGDFQQFLKDAGLTVHDLGPIAQQVEESAASSLQPDALPLPYQRRRHWIAAVGRVVPRLILAALMLIWLVLAGGKPGDFSHALFLGVRVLLALAFVGWAAWEYINWRNDLFIVTSEAVVHIERELLMSEERYEAPLHQIQNVNLHTNVLGQILGFGDLLIETAAARGQVTFTTIPKPREAQDLIRRAADEAKSGRQMQEIESIRQRLEDYLAPERLRPEVPGSVLVDPPPPPGVPVETKPYRPPPFFIPPFEEHQAGRIIWRKHWFNLFQRTGLPVLASGLAGVLLLLIILPLVAGAFRVNLPEWIDAIAQVWLIPVVLVMQILALLWFKYRWVDWKNDIYILARDEVIDQERALAVFPIWWLYSETRRSASLANVQYVDLRIPNLVAMIFNYGDVIVQTAGATGRLDFMFVRNPRRVHATILRHLAEFQEHERQRQFEERWQDMAQWLEAYHDVTRRERANGT
ncbi:MAG: cyclic nucleotide-binding domain-containing protein, partial [Anaerolineae bacterium]|nr:cyclic nucleotide-binding domain-containing protein [Anaerolineae bacterium]